MVFIVSVAIFCALAFVVLLLVAMYKFGFSYLKGKNENRVQSKKFILYSIYSLAVLALMAVLFYFVRQNQWLLEYVT